jgi:hypothetical protein
VADASGVIDANDASLLLTAFLWIQWGTLAHGMRTEMEIRE